jgi:hypothetical protein
MKTFRYLILLLLVFVLASCNLLSTTPSITPEQPQPESPTPQPPIDTPAVDTPAPSPTEPPVELPTDTPTATETPIDLPGELPLEPIMILEPWNGSRVLSPVRIFGFADSTFEQNLVIRIYLADGTLLTTSFTTIQADLGQRGPFEVEVEFDIEGEENAFIQVFSDSARDGGITHLNSVGVLLADQGEAEIVSVDPYLARIAIFSPSTRDVISGGLARVEGFGLASFEQTLILEVQDENGDVIASTPFMVMAPDIGFPGPFQAEVSYHVTHEQPGRIVVWDQSMAFGGEVYLTSVEVQLRP